MSNFGIGLGSFMSGVAQGANTMMSIKRGIRAEEMAEKQEARAADNHAWQQQQRQRLTTEQTRTDAEAAETRAANASAATAATTAMEADVAAGKPARSLTDYWFENANGIIADHLKNGRAEQAAKLDTALKDSRTRVGVEAMERAARAYQNKDMDGLIAGVNEAQKSPIFAGQIPEIVGWKQLEGKDGQPGNVEFTLKRDGTDETFTRDYSLGEIQSMLLSGASPGAALKRLEQQQAASDKLRAEASKGVIQERREIAKETRDNAESDRRAGRDQTNRLEAQNNASWLREAERAAAANLKISPDEARKQVAAAQKDLLANNPRFANMTSEDQQAAVMKYLEDQDAMTRQRQGQTSGNTQSRGVVPPLHFGR